MNNHGLTRLATHMVLGGRRYIEMIFASSLCAALTMAVAVATFALPTMLVVPARLLALFGGLCAARFALAARRGRRL